jgi:hypothetical protein
MLSNTAAVELFLDLSGRVETRINETKGAFGNRTLSDSSGFFS